MEIASIPAPTVLQLLYKALEHIETARAQIEHKAPSRENLHAAERAVLAAVYTSLGEPVPRSYQA